VHKFWGWLGLNLGKHWIRVLVIGTIVTVVLGYGITRRQGGRHPAIVARRWDVIRIGCSGDQLV